MPKCWSKLSVSAVISKLRQKFTPEFLTFVVVRLSGVGVRPLVLFLSGLSARENFGNDYALLVSALAGLFVLCGAQTHIPYYRRRFSAETRAYRQAFVEYLRDTLMQYLMVLPLVAALALLWTHDPVVLAAIVLLVGVEKFFDEDMRHFQFTREYYRWSLSFMFRTIFPAACALAVMPFWHGRLIVAYIGASLLSVVLYGLIRNRHFAFYLRQALRADSRPMCGESRLSRFVRRWREDLVFNQLWTFASVNILLVDRLLVANLYPTRIHEYVFFANVFNLINVAHSMFYFVSRRPDLIRDTGATGWSEIARPANVLPPFLYLVVSIAIAMVARYTSPAYTMVSPVLFGGLAIFYLLQAINLVGIEYIFWRVSRLRLVLFDGSLVLTIGGTIFSLKPPLEWIPYITSAGLFIRMAVYQWLAYIAARHPAGAALSLLAPVDQAK